MNELIDLVELWAKARNFDKTDPSKQFLKVAEEFGEIGAAMARGNKELLKDSIGDTVVTLIILAMQSGTNLEECLQIAYGVIKNRKGKMIDGVFVKEDDL